MAQARMRAEAKARVEERHWWYRGRRLVLDAALGGLDLPARPRLLDAGCGSGRNLPLLARYGDVAGFDADPHAAELAHARGVGLVRTGRVERIPFEEGGFDVVACLDVLEHVDDEQTALQELLRVTRPGGAALVSVPAYPALWSSHDLAAGHRRRYRARELRRRTADAGWLPAGITHFHAAALGPAAVVRLSERLRGGAEPRSQLRFELPFADRALLWPARLERRLLAQGRRLPVGLSLLATLRRPGR